ncbi:MAG TPA: ABC-type transport auxiliary lipoprotein family protein [Oligoflexia bacterium]|nr:ABC-type transport auxiliary lipoprotein family protein [Oligoflexia bacterium]
MKKKILGVNLLLVVITAMVAAGCGPLLGVKKAEESYYVLTDNERIPDERLPASRARLLVSDTKANPFINSQRIIFSEDPSRRGYYQLAKWVESPAKRFTLLLIQRFIRAGVFASVSSVGGATLGDLQVNTEVTEFYHNIRTMPGKIVISVNAELVDLIHRVSIKSQLFELEVPVKDYSAEGAVSAFSQGVNVLLDRIVVWAAKNAPETGQ